MGGNGRTFENLPSLTKIAMSELAAVSCNGRKMVKLCRSEGVIWSEGVKWCKSWAAKGGKMVEEYGGICSEGL